MISTKSLRLEDMEISVSYSTKRRVQLLNRNVRVVFADNSKLFVLDFCFPFFSKLAIILLLIFVKNEVQGSSIIRLSY